MPGGRAAGRQALTLRNTQSRVTLENSMARGSRFPQIPFAGRAIYRDGILRVEGQARFPNDFSTATLQPRPDDRRGTSPLQAFDLVFHRDKEPYCNTDLIGPVVYEGRSPAFAVVDVVRVYVTADRYEDVRVERA